MRASTWRSTQTARAAPPSSPVCSRSAATQAAAASAVAFAAAQQARLFIGPADIGGRGGEQAVILARQGQPRGGGIGLRAGQARGLAPGTGEVAREGQAVEAAPMVVGGQPAAEAQQQVVLAIGIAGCLGPAAADGCLRLGRAAGAVQRLGVAQRALQGARGIVGEVTQREGIVAVHGQGDLGPPVQRVGEGPVRILGDEGDDLIGRDRRGAVGQAHPQRDLGGERVRHGGVGLRFRPSSGRGGGERLAAGQPGAFGRPGLRGSGKGKGEQGKEEQAAHG